MFLPKTNNQKTSKEGKTTKKQVKKLYGRINKQDGEGKSQYKLKRAASPDRSITDVGG